MPEGPISGHARALGVETAYAPERRVRVLHIIGDLEVGGAQISLLRLLEYLRYESYDFRVICLKQDGRLRARLERLSIPVISLNLQGDLPSLRAIPLLTRHVRMWNPHIIHAWLYHANLLSGLVGLLGRHPLLLWSIRHGELDPELDQRPTIWVARVGAWLSSWLPDRVICNSESACRFHVQFGYNQLKMRMIANGFDVERFQPDPQARQLVRQRLGIDGETMVVGHFGRFHPQKGQRIFLEAAAQILEGAEDLQFLMGGRDVDPGNAELVKWLEELGLQDKVRLLGLRDDMSGIINALDLLAMTSLVESFPNVVGEAMACGVPCVVTAVGDAAEVVGDTGRVVPKGDPAAIAAALVALTRMSKAERAALGVEARDRIIEHYSMHMCLEKHREMYADLMDQG